MGDYLAATTISLLNMKGGVGKTTLSVNLAWHLSRRAGKKVLLVDLDPQFNASQYLMTYDTYATRLKRGTIADIFIEPTRSRMPATAKKKSAKKYPNIKNYIHCVEERSNGAKFDVLPSELSLARVVKNPQGADYKLQRALQTLRDDYDYVFIDCAPTDSVLTTTALMASNYVLVPVKPDRFSVLGYGQILEAIDEFKQNYPDPNDVTDLGVIFTQIVGNNAIESQCMTDVRKQANYVFDAMIPKSNTYLRSVHEQTPVFDTLHSRRLTKATISKLSTELRNRIEEIESG